MKKILFVNHTAKLGGAELSLLDIVQDHKKNSAVLLFSNGEYEEILNEKGIKCIIEDLDPILLDIKKDSGIRLIIKGVFGLLKKLTTIKKILNEYDIIYSNTLKSFVICSLVSIINRKKIVLHLRDALTNEHFSKFSIKLIIFISSISNARVIANSNYTKECFVEHGGNSKKCEVIWNGIDPDGWTKSVSKSIRNTNVINILSLGRISPWKGQHLVLEAIKNIPYAHLRIVGSANFGEHDYYDSLIKFVKDNKLENRVTFYPFSLNVAEHFEWSNVFVHSSTAPEPFGRVIVEAMLCDRIVIATDAGGAKEIINSSEVGILVPVNDAEAITSAINNIYFNSSKYENISSNGKVRASTVFNTANLLKNINGYLEKI
ncbi:TPA: glycosyltransferase family 4 protein [Klebsiella pneumoniae]|uniref:glycosyltransferase family 4 protein n=1 Tax=Klebsiella pneumoniae TaxID=573 RepID=UPI000E2B1FFC|nr:glycosyltransferase family 4 protein [Klebsiella pneumoniae]ELA3317241.1 glycosyltransferase family 4 protein [Klebsiella pneumoniae]MBQ5142861.1 glycosyltransferase family 4 protein [Klebsiella pneumoniae]MDZ2673829.1 glycosyltransferase family 4 protein [Klebsiella pneumoniae]QLN42091.1 glycosyltransferase family 4 protein [Klebsiella pneumoniae]SWX04587.1 group 1 glycosyl transferase [Klebsiella pneumoniae]